MPRSSRQFWFYWLPPLLLSGGILVLSGDLGSYAHTRDLVNWLLSWLPFLPVEEMQQGQGYLRIAGHIAAYASLYYLWFRAFKDEFPRRKKLAILGSLSLCLFVSLLDEGHQSQVASRHGCLQDVALDFGAAVLTALALSCKRE